MDAKTIVDDDMARAFLSPIEVLPHRAPFLFIDDGAELRSDSAACWGTFNPANPVFAGHFPGDAIVPGVLLLEAMAQTLAWWAIAHHPGHRVLLTGIDKARFRRVVRPAERVRYEIAIVRILLGEIHAKATATVDGVLAASALVKGYLNSAEP